MRVGVFRVAVAALAVAAAAGITAPGAPARIVVLVQTQRSIADIDANSAWLGWQYWKGKRRRPGCGPVIRRRSWATGATSPVYRCHRSYADRLAMVLAGDAVVWTRTTVESQGCCDSEFNTRLRTSTAVLPVDRAYHRVGCDGDEIGALAAHGGLAAYTKSIWTSTYCPGNPVTGQASMTGGTVRLLRMPSGAPTDVAGTPPAAFLAVSPTRLVLVPYDLAAGTINRAPPPKPEIQVWSLDSRTRERTIPETGTIAGIAIRKAHLAVLVSDGSGTFRIDRFVASTGAADGTTSVPASVQPQLALWRTFIVYAAGHTVRAVNTATGRTHVVARIRRWPYDVVAARGRAIWLSGGARLSRISTAPIR